MPTNVDPSRDFTWQQEFRLPATLAPPAAVCHPFLQRLHSTLTAPLRPGHALECDLARLHLIWTAGNAAALETALMLVSYSYGLRYLGHQDPLTAADLAIGPAHGANSRTLLALQEYEGGLLPVGTLTTGSGSDLDLFDLFEAAPNVRWPHQQAAGDAVRPGEVCRFGLHPLFDLLDQAADPATRRRLDFYRRLILRRLTSACLDWLIAGNITVAYCVVGPHLRLFMRRSGMHVAPVAGVQPRSTVAVTRMRRQFARYWRPDEAPNRQPAPHQLTGIIRPVAELPDLPAEVVAGRELALAVA